MSFRILVAGSRAWTDKHIIGSAIAQAVPDHLVVPGPPHSFRARWDQITVVHGACPRGADRIADRIAKAWGMQVEPHPADWTRHGRGAGPRRNADMVALGADLCLAFPIGRSPGTRGCIALAEQAGIPVIVHEGGAA